MTKLSLARYICAGEICSRDPSQGSQGSQSSLSQMIFRISVLKKIAIFTGKHLQAWKIDSNTGVFLWALRNIEEQLFYRTPPVGAYKKRPWHRCFPLKFANFFLSWITSANECFCIMNFNIHKKSFFKWFSHLGKQFEPRAFLSFQFQP